MAYGTVKVDTVTFTYASGDTSTTFSGLHASTTNNLTLSGTASANTFTGTTANFTNTNAQNISVTTLLSGLAITGGTAGFTTVTGTTVTGTTANFVTVSGTSITGGTAGFTTITGTTVTGTTANFVTLSGTTVTGNIGQFTSLTGATTTMTSGVFASGTEPLPSISFVSDPNTGIYSPGADQLAVATNGVARLTTSTTLIASVLPVNIYNASSMSSVPTLAVGGGTFNTSDQGGSITLGNAVVTPTGAPVRLRSGFGGFSSGYVNESGFFAIDTNDITGLQERMRITSGGLVGIGNSSPRGIIHVGADLHNGATDAAAINLKQTSTTAATGIYLERSAERKGYYIYLGGSEDSLNFQRNSSGTKSDVMSLTRDGLVGIGTTGPSALLDVRGSGTVAYFLQNVGSSGISIGVDTNLGKIGTNGATCNLAFNIDGIEKVRIRSDGMFEVKGAGTSGSSPAFSVNGSAPANSAIIDTSGRLLVGTSTSVENVGGNIQVNGGNATINTFVANSAAYRLYFVKSRSGTFNGKAIVQSDDDLGRISFNGDDGVDYSSEAASIACQVDGTPGSDDMPGRLVFSTTPSGSASPTERMRLGNSGNAEFFVSAAALTVRASGGSTSTNNALSITSGATGTTDGTLRFVVETRGNVFNQNNAYGSLSDVKLKENIVDASSQWSDLKNLKVRKYNFKEIPGHTQIGLVAQEVELVSPGLVSESPDRDEEGNDLGTVTKSVSYSVLYMKAVKALQEAMERIEQLETSNTDLLTRVIALEAN